MGSYDGMSYEELVAAFTSIDPAPVRASSGSWNQANGKTADVGTLLAKRLSALMHDWKGVAAGAFNEYMDEIGKFCAKLAADEAEMSAGMAELAADGASYKAKAEALTNPPPKNAKEKEKVRKELAKLLGELGGRYRGSDKKYFRTPTKAPATLPKDDDFVQDAPLNVVDTYEGTPDPFQDPGPPPTSNPLPAGSGRAGAPTSRSSKAAATRDWPRRHRRLQPRSVTGRGRRWFARLRARGDDRDGVEFGDRPGHGRFPWEHGDADRFRPLRRGGGAHRGQAHGEEEDEGNRTWLTEDEMVWGNARGDTGARS